MAPRAGFTWNVGGKNSFVIRGGSGLYFATPVSNVTFSPQVYSNLITASFPNDGRADFVDNPTNGVPADDFLTGKAPLPVQSPRTINTDFKNPYTWQSSIGFQKQINDVTGFEADLTHYNLYRDTRSIDANLAYNPATGYNMPVSAGRPNKEWGQVLQFVSDGSGDQTQVSMALNRRLHNHVQGGVTYTVMLAMHDNGTIGYTTPTPNNPFDYLNGEYATSTSFQRNTVRAWGLFQMPLGLSLSLSYAYGSGNMFNDTIRDHTVRQSWLQPAQFDGDRSADQRHHHPGVRPRSVERPCGDQLGCCHPPQRPAGSGAPQGRPPADRGHQAGR